MELADAQTSGCGPNIQVEINGTHNSITTLLVDKNLCTLRISLTTFQDYPHTIKILQQSCNMQTIAKILVIEKKTDADLRTSFGLQTL